MSETLKELPINFHIGLMGCGKSEILINHYNKTLEKYPDIIVKAFLPIDFTKEEFIHTRNEDVKDIKAHNANELLNIDIRDSKVYAFFIDEGQFLSTEHVDKIFELAMLPNVCFYISLMPINIEDKNWSTYDYISKLVEEGNGTKFIVNKDKVNITYIELECQECHERNATKIRRKNGNTDLIVIDRSVYVSVCDKCAEALDNKRKKNE